jgi:hypothetical protein
MVAPWTQYDSMHAMCMHTMHQRCAWAKSGQLADIWQKIANQYRTTSGQLAKIADNQLIIRGHLADISGQLADN